MKNILRELRAAHTYARRGWQWPSGERPPAPPPLRPAPQCDLAEHLKRRRAGVDAVNDRVADAIRSARGITLPDLMEVLKMKQSTVYVRLHDLMERGIVTRIKVGKLYRYRIGGRDGH